MLCRRRGIGTMKTKLTKREEKLVNRMMQKGVNLTPAEAVAAVGAVDKLHRIASFFRLTHRVKCDGHGGLWSLTKERVMERFSSLSEQMQQLSDKGKDASDVVVFECRSGEEKEIKRFKPKRGKKKPPVQKKKKTDTKVKKQPKAKKATAPSQETTPQFKSGLMDDVKATSAKKPPKRVKKAS